MQQFCLKNIKHKINQNRYKDLKEFAGLIKINFINFDFLNQALTHTSFANESKKDVNHNERLEFLGDAVLELVISSYLFENFINLPEGELTKARAAVVCEPTLAKRALTLNLGQYLLFGKGEISTGGRERASILADAFEALIGAIYLDCGIEQARSFILEQLKDDLLTIKDGKYISDYKTLLQELIQAQADSKISYEIISESGPDHNKIFDVAVLINGSVLGNGMGKSKKEAAQLAAKQALSILKN